MPDDPNTDPKEQTTATTAPTPATTPPPPAPEELGDAGKKAIEEERRARRDAEKAARDAHAELEKLRAASLSDQERAVADARREGERVGLRRIVEAELKAAAAGKLANPALAAKLLDVDGFIPKDGDDVDGERIAEAVAKLLETDPYLAAPTAPAPSTAPAEPSAPAGRPNGTAPGGARGQGTASPVTFSRSQLRDPRFYADNKDAILAAAREGRITND